MAKSKTQTNSIVSRLLSNSNSPFKGIFSEAAISTTREICTSRVPLLNVAHSGSIYGGVQLGSIIQYAGESKRFKTTFCLSDLGDFHRAFPDGIGIIYDSEGGFGYSGDYLDACGVDKDRAIWIPVRTIEELKVEMCKQLDDLYESKVNGEEIPKIMIVIDSIGNLASKKEMDDATADKITAEVGTRPKALKSFFRSITSQVKLLNIAVVMAGHSYSTLEMFSKQVVSGGAGSILACDSIYFINKRQIKDGTDVTGWTFELVTHKSRNIREGSKFPIDITYDGGIKKYSGLADLALEFGLIEDSGRSYVFQGSKFPKKTIDDDEAFWNAIFENTNFAELVEAKYKIANSSLIKDSITEEAENSEES